MAMTRQTIFSCILGGFAGVLSLGWHINLLTSPLAFTTGFLISAALSFMLHKSLSMRDVFLRVWTPVLAICTLSCLILPPIVTVLFCVISYSVACYILTQKYNTIDYRIKHMLCLHCGYEVDLSAVVCSECGHNPFDKI
jgi:hypothetical protein